MGGGYMPGGMMMQPQMMMYADPNQAMSMGQAMPYYGVPLHVAPFEIDNGSLSPLSPVSTKTAQRRGSYGPFLVHRGIGCYFAQFLSDVPVRTDGGGGGSS